MVSGLRETEGAMDDQNHGGVRAVEPGEDGRFSSDTGLSLRSEQDN